MNLIPEKFNRGIDAAREAIDAGRLTYFTGAPSKASWGIDLADTLREKFGLAVEFVSDITDDAASSFHRGFNEAIEDHMDQVYGKGSLAAALAEVQQRRLQRYELYFAHRTASDESNRA